MRAFQWAGRNDKQGGLFSQKFQLEQEKQIMDSKSLVKSVKGWVRELTEIGILLLALSVVLALLLGDQVPFLTTAGDVVNNITALISDLGDSGIVGLIALGVIMYLFNRKDSGA